MRRRFAPLMTIALVATTGSPVAVVVPPCAAMPWLKFPLTPGVAVALALIISLPATAQTASPRQARLLVDHDGHGLFSTLTTHYQTDIDELVGDLPSNVTTFLLCSGAGRYYYPTKVGDVDPRLRQLNAEHAAGHDPFGYFLERLHASGRETFITFRMNDTHNPTDADNWNTPRVRLEHPDVVVDAEAIARNDKATMNWALDYSRPEVQA